MKKQLTITVFFLFTVWFALAENDNLQLNRVPSTFETDNEIPVAVKKWLQKELSNTTTEVLTDFSSPAFYTSKKAKIVGYIKGYDQSIGAKTGIFYYKNSLTKENAPKVLEIHKDGRFELELPLDYPMLDFFEIENRAIQFYLEPGQNLSIILNWEDLKNKSKSWVKYQGALSTINTHLQQFKPRYPYDYFHKSMEELSAEVFKQKLFEVMEYQLNKVKAYHKSGEIDAKTTELLMNDIEQVIYRYMFSYFSTSKKIELKKKGIEMKSLIPEGYYDFVKKIPLKRQSMLVNNQFNLFINYLEFSPVMNNENSRVYYETFSIFSIEFLDYAKNKGIKVTENDEKLAESLLNETDEKAVWEKASSYFKKYINCFNNEFMSSDLIKEKRLNSFKQIQQNVWKEKDSLATLLGFKNKLVYDIIKSRMLKVHLDNEWASAQQKTWWWDYIKTNIHSPHLKNLGDDLLKKNLEKTSFYKLPENEPGTTAFKKIIEPYKGKIVVVQFWNPHTYYRKGGGLERGKKRRAQFKDHKEVVFLHISNEEDSSLEKYNQSVKENGFENSIRVSQDDYHYFRQLFKFHFSVCDVLIDKQQRQVLGYSRLYYLETILKEEFNILPNDSKKE